MKNYSKAKILLLIISGWLLGGFGFTTTLGNPISTISFILGILMFIIGVIFLFK